MNRSPVPPHGGVITIINEPNKETEFFQSNAYINCNTGLLSTCNLVNCISVGGIFKSKNNKQGSFLTHESPLDYSDLIYKLYQIKQKLKKCAILKLIIFCPSNPSKDIYENNFTTEKIIKIIIKDCISKFELEPEIKLYQTNDCMFGKSIISPNYINTKLQFIKKQSEIKTKLDTFTPIIIKNEYGYVYQCPYNKCKCITGIGAVKYPNDISYWSHNYNCINKNKIVKSSNIS